MLIRASAATISLRGARAKSRKIKLIANKAIARSHHMIDEPVAQKRAAERPVVSRR
jgi:hypothetical protein